MSIDDDYTNVILEEIREKFDIILEGLTGLKDVPAKITKLDQDITEVKTDIKVIKVVVTDQSKELANHEHRLAVLEMA